MSDFLVGLAAWGGALQVASATPPQTGSFVPLVTLGAFLMMAAALLMWASANLAERAPVVFWQGLVRLSAVIAVVYAVPAALAENAEYVLILIDLPIGLAYVIGSVRVTGCSPLTLLLCGTRATAYRPPSRP